MKRKLSLLMVLMMVLTLIPAMPSFAASDNRVDRIVPVKSDDKLDGANTPNLIIFGDGKGDMDTTTSPQTFRVELSEGAKWIDGTPGYPDGVNVTLTTGTTPATAKRQSDRRLEVTINPGSTNPKIYIPMYVEFDGAPEGAQKVKVVSLDSGVTPGDYTYATIGAGDVTVKVDKKVKISRSGNEKVDVLLDETAVGSFETGDNYTLRLPKNFAWKKPSDTSLAAFTLGNDDRDLQIKILVADSNKLESISINTEVVPNRDAKYGDVTMTIAKGDVSPSSLVIAEYVDYVGVVKVDKVLDVVSGKVDNGLYVAKVIIEEPVKGTLLQGRRVEFSFNKDIAALENGEDLKITRKSGTVELELQKEDALESISNAPRLSTATIDTVNLNADGKATTKYDSHLWETLVKGTSTDASKFEMEIPFVVSANYEGDVVLTVKGAGIDSQDVVIAKAKKPVTVEIDKNSSADLKIGLQKQTAPDIIITETEAGALTDDTLYTIVNRYSENNIIWKDAKIEVVEGDLELDKDDTDINAADKGIDIKVDSKSTKASKIKISGVQVTLDRTVPYGPFELDFKFGTAANQHDNLSNRVDRKVYFNVVTPAPGDQNATTTFKMDSTAYTMIVNGQPQEMTMDVAPFIQDNRAMLPIKYVADAIGAKVNYDPMSRVATFTKDATVAALYLDSNILYVNGTPVTMDTKPVISNGRAMVPVIYVAQAFGFQYGTDLVYDAATRSVTIFPAAK